MQVRWLNLLFMLLVLLLFALCWHLFIYAKTPTAASLVLQIIKPLSVLLLLTLFFIISRNLVKLYL